MSRRALSLLAVSLLLASASPVSADPSSLARSTAGAPPETAQEDYIVVLRDREDVTQKVNAFSRSHRVRANLTYRHAFRGFAARLTRAQRHALAADPAVAYLVPDWPIRVEGQIVPTGVARVGALRTDTAAIDGVDRRVDADIAIVDTGIQWNHPDLNVVGGYNCSSADRFAWNDGQGHGTHVAGTAAALDNGIGVVGVAPGARLWAVKVFDNWGNGRLSWYVCGVEWIAAQRDRTDPRRPLFEVANMSLRTDRRRDDQNCGYTNNDPLHHAVCRAVAGGTTIVAAAGNQSTWASSGVPAAYDEVITVSALADFNGRPGGGARSTCSSWGSPDVDDTHADFSNFGGDVDIKAPGKCILSTYPGSRYKVSSGTSMAAPAVAGAVALWKSRHPGSSPAAVKAVLQAAGRLDWAIWTDPDPYHERMLDVSSFGRGPDFSLSFSTGVRIVGPAGGTIGYTLQVTRGDAFSGSIYLTASGLPRGASARFSANPSSGVRGLASTLTVTVPANTAEGTYDLTVTGTAGALRRTARTRLTVDRTPPTVNAPGVRLNGPVIGYFYLPTLLNWSGADAVAGTRSFEIQRSVNGGPFATIGRFPAATRQTGLWLSPDQSYRFRARATDRVGNVSGWATAASFRLHAPEETSSSIAYGGAWRREALADARGGAVRYATTGGAWARLTFTGRQVSWAAHRGPTRGWAHVYVNGTYLTAVGLWASTARPRTVVFLRTWPDSALRTVEVRVVGTAGRPRVDVDAFVLLR